MFGTDAEMRLTKIKHQIVFELMFHRKEKLRMLLEKVNFQALSGMNKYQILHAAIEQLKEMSTSDELLLDRVEKQVGGVLANHYEWFE